MHQTDINAHPENTSQIGRRKRRKKPAYTGGRVLDAKTGFYDNYILLLDFNSLYPSIIREMNICHTTIRRGEYEEEQLDQVYISPTPGIIPQVVADLIERRKEVRAQMRKVRADAALQAPNSNALKVFMDRLQVLDTTQLAFKIVANSMYGCFGFESMRFYAKRLAQIITYNGRRLLTEARVRVEKLNYEVIYGDTDSLMIDMKCRSLREAISAGRTLSTLINRNRQYLHIDIDGIFSALLLLTKKKYAAMKLSTDVDDAFNSPANARFKLEVRGIEIVRRDWCQITRQAETDLLRILLGDDGVCRFETEDTKSSTRSSASSDADVLREDEEDVLDEQGMAEEMAHSAVGRMDSYLRQLGHRLRTGQWKRSEFEITKSIVKDPSEYPDAQRQPHVLVAMEMKSLQMNVHPGDAIPYIICAGTANWSQRVCYLFFLFSLLLRLICYFSILFSYCFLGSSSFISSSQR